MANDMLFSYAILPNFLQQQHNIFSDGGLDAFNIARRRVQKYVVAGGMCRNFQPRLLEPVVVHNFHRKL